MNKEYNISAESSDEVSILKQKIRELEQLKSGMADTCISQQKIIKLFNGVINTVTDLIVFTDLNGKILFVNDCTVQSSGLNREEIEGNDLLIFLPVEYKKEGFDNILFMLQEKQEPDETTLIMKEGKRVPFEIKCDLLLDTEGVPSGFIFLCRDISSRLRKDSMIRIFEERLSSIAANIPGVVFQICLGNDGKYRLNYLSERGSEYSGIISTDLDKQYRSFIASIHSGDRNDFIRSIVNAGEKGSPWNYVFRYIRSSGETVWLHGLSLPSYDNNEIIFNGILLDISDLKQAENKSVMSEEKFSKVFMTAPDCIAITRISDALIIDTNSGFEEITGWKPEEVIGISSYDMKFWHDLSEREFLKRELESGRDIINREFEFRRKDGETRSGIYSARPIQINSDFCLIIVIQDITDRKRMEAEKARLEEQLLYSQKMDAIGQLAGGVAHDFNNILMELMGNVSLILLGCDPDDKNYHRLKRIENSIERGSDLTKQLLGFARKGKYNPRVLLINSLILNSARFFLETRKEIEAEFDLQEGIFPIEVDEGQIEQVLLNLYINAAHAMPGGGRLSLKTSGITLQEVEAAAFNIKAGDYVKISVSDTGVGMSEEILKRVFEPFFTTKSPDKGTGMGLASAYGIVRNHGGIINAYSRPGQGTTFNIFLPSSDKIINNDKPDENTALIYGSGGILLVDDEQQILNSTSELLSKLGYNVYTASNGKDAIDTYNEKHGIIKLAILDMIMPGINGLILLQKLREINPGIRVIFSSGYSLQEDIQKAVDKGGYGFIQKPFRITDLAGMINKTLKNINQQ